MDTLSVQGSSFTLSKVVIVIDEHDQQTVRGTGDGHPHCIHSSKTRSDLRWTRNSPRHGSNSLLTLARRQPGDWR